jgi:ppGpp synthetase/RelA/SpoT-type nucleotidyltranferase
VEWWTSPEDMHFDKWNPAYQVVKNWRACHGLPLNVIQAGLRQRIRRIEQNVVVAQRLKRFSSIMNKLTRESDVKLSQMQDLGGCRAILSNVSAVNDLYRKYQQPEQTLYEEGSLKCYDYITDPKEDG